MKKEFTVPYKNQQRTFEIQMRDPWDWAVDILMDPVLAPCLVWDAQIRSSWIGDDWERFFTEPWTAESFWDAQVSA